MSNGKPLTCLRCGASIASGFECAACASPPPPQTATYADDPPTEPERSDAPKLVLSGLLVLVMLGVLGFGARNASASMAREKAEAARKQAARLEKYEKAEADRKAAEIARQAPPPAAASGESEAEFQERMRREREESDRRVAAIDAETRRVTEEMTRRSAEIQAPPQAVDCQRCGGTGKVDADCGECNGEGESECEECELYNARYNRGGNPNCPTCHGTSHRVDARGRRFLGVAYIYTCLKCSGSGKRLAHCYLCNGTGKISP